MVFNTYKVKFTIIKYITLIMFIFMLLFILFLFNGLIEMAPANLILQSFKERGEYCETISINKQEVNIYTVIPKYDYEIADTRTAFRKDSSYGYYIGSNLDIIITNRNPLRFESMAIVRDFGNFFSKNFYIGHATINIADDGRKFIESVGNDNGNNGVRIKDNDWIYTEINIENDAQTIIGLRIKNLTLEKINKISDDLLKKVGLSYNYNFLINKRNSYYCTDLISRVLYSNGINIDYDYFYPTGNDFIISNNTFPIFICEKIEKGKFNIYYLSEG